MKIVREEHVRHNFSLLHNYTSIKSERFDFVVHRKMTEADLAEDIRVEWTDFLKNFHENHPIAQQSMKKVNSNIFFSTNFSSLTLTRSGRSFSNEKQSLFRFVQSVSSGRMSIFDKFDGRNR